MTESTGSGTDPGTLDLPADPAGPEPESDPHRGAGGSTAPDEPDDDLDAVIVGAGFAGLYLVHSLRSAGFRVLAYEAADDVGGTWYWNRYPGARCDVMSMDYSYSFDPELEQEWTWSEKYAGQAEILRYAEHVADRYDLRRSIRFSTRVASAAYDAAERRWTVSTDRGDRVRTRHLVLATGCLSAAAEPDISGTDCFEGWSYRTSAWPRGGVDFSGQRVAVIGTGSSAVQAIPLIAEQAAELTVFQRTPNYSMPANNRPLSDAEVTDHKASYRERREEARRSFFGMVGGPHNGVGALTVSDEERLATYRAGWEAGTLVGVLGSYNDLLVDPDANDTVSDYLRSQIRGLVDDPATAAMLCPTDYPFGARRPCLDTDYYATFNRDDVTLVDLRRTPIVKITPRGIDTSEASFEVDTIVYATGFDALTGAITRIDITGRDGRRLADQWRDGARTYLGLMVSGFPNLFTVTGPGSPSVLSNMMVSIEQHVEWITDCLVHLRDKGLGVIEPTQTAEADPDAQEDWVGRVRDLADATLMPQAESWYLGANVADKPRVFLPYAGGVGAYRATCDEVVARGYEGFELN